jgi:hypothetical protein
LQSPGSSGLKKGCVVALGTPLALVAGLVVLLWFSFYSIHVRYRLTVEVQDGDQVKTGSSVIDVAYSIQPDGAVNLGGRDTQSMPVGYAPTVDLGEKGVLFLTFAYASPGPEYYDGRNRNQQFSCPLDDIGCVPFAAYSRPGTGFGPYSQEKEALDQLIRQSGPRDVPFVMLPKLVRFRDVTDPHTSVRVSPYDLAASFGPGVKLKRVILELTNDPVTPPPKNWPQWLTIRRQNTEFRGYERD